MKIGIYSGTFDPIHDGHVAFAMEAIEKCGLDKVFFLPEPRPRRKQGVKAFEHRVKMTEIAVKDEPKLGVVVLDQPRFTPNETMPILLNRFKGTELCMLMGDDMLDHFADWPHVEELINSIKFVIGVRKYDEEHVLGVIKTIDEVTGANIRFELFQPSHSTLSSSDIKKSIKQSDYSGLSRAVASYIKLNGLYSFGEK